VPARVKQAAYVLVGVCGGTGLMFGNVCVQVLRNRARHLPPTSVLLLFSHPTHSSRCGQYSQATFIFTACFEFYHY